MSIIYQSIIDIGRFGGSYLFIAVVMGTFFYFLMKGDLVRLLCVGLNILSGFYSNFLKGLFQKPRPIGYTPPGPIKWQRVLANEDFSFPSTHVIFYTAFFGYLFYLTFKLKGVDGIVRHVIRYISIIMILVVGVSRILSGAHFVRDIVYGYIFGLIYLLFVIGVEKVLEQRLHKKQEKLK